MNQVRRCRLPILMLAGVNRIVWLAAVSILMTGCGEGGVGDWQRPGAPQLQFVGLVRLMEADSLYLGRPISLAIDPDDGSFYVGDVVGGRVIRYGRHGKPQRTYAPVRNNQAS